MANVVDTRGELPFISAKRRFPAHVAPRPVGTGVKRSIDLVLAAFGILLFSPLLLLCCLALILFSPGPLLFRHRRVGFNGQTFDCLKFRTMAPDAAERLQRLLESDPAAAAEWKAARKLRADPRVTPLGAALRRSSLDELPQLFNVIRGDMSIVGPRPVTEEELARYAYKIDAYLACRPGITGLWQVSGRSTTTYRRRVACDAFYARNWSIMLDAKIMLATIPAVFEDAAY
ncbi:exopolysaccharide production protein ExoY [Bradyrhizobium sp. USDA 3397]